MDKYDYARTLVVDCKYTYHNIFNKPNHVHFVAKHNQTTI